MFLDFWSELPFESLQTLFSNLSAIADKILSKKCCDFDKQCNSM
jgi:hypothetical protein